MWVGGQAFVAMGAFIVSGSEADEAERARQATAGLLRKVFVATLLGAFVFAVLSLYGDVQMLVTHLGSFAWWAFGGALLLATANYALRYVRWQYYLVVLGFRVPHIESGLVFLAGFVMSVTPGKVGEVFKSLLLYEARGISMARTAPIVFAERLTDLLALVLLTALGCLSFEQGVPIALTGAAVVLFLVVASSWRPLGGGLLALAVKLPFVARFSSRLHEAYEALLTLNRPRTMLAATLLSTLSWGLECVALYLLVLGFSGAHLGIWASCFAYSASTIAGALAMMPGGLGVTEAGMTGLIQRLGTPEVSLEVAVASTILIRIATLWWAVLVGGLALALWQRRSARTREGR